MVIDTEVKTTMNTSLFNFCSQDLRKDAVPTKGLVIFDSAVEDYQALQSATLSGFETAVLNFREDGIQQISALLAGYRNLRSLHIVSHAQPGMLLLGKGWLDHKALSRRATSIREWAEALAEDAELLIYGCEVAKGSLGRAFIHQLSVLTGAKVAASTTKTGNAVHGGNWNLEVATASMSGRLAFWPSMLMSYSAVLGSLTQYNVNTATESSYPSDFINFDGTLYFVASGLVSPSTNRELWKIDPGSGHAIKVSRDLKAYDYQPSYLLRTRDALYYTTQDLAGNSALWKIDAGSATPIRLDISSLATSSNLTQLTNINDTLYFTANDNTNGSKLWTLDTSGQVVPVNFQTAGVYGTITDLTDVNGVLYFTDFEFLTRSIWKIDPLTNQPVFIADSAISSRGNAKAFTNINGTLYFKSGDYTSNNWRFLSIDSSSTTPKPIDSVNAAVSVVSIESITDVNGVLYFTARGLNDFETELWTYRPSTNAVKRIDVYPGTASSYPQNLTNVDGTLYFTANGSSGSFFDVPTRGRELWKIDAVTDEPVRLTDGSTLDLGSYAESIVNVNGTLYFNATDSTYGAELWKLDTKTGKSELVSDINPGSSGSNPRGLRNENGVLYFSASDLVHGIEPWKLDPETGKPMLIADINTIDLGSDPSSALSVNGILYFIAQDPINGRQLWKINPSTHEPNRITNFPFSLDPFTVGQLTDSNGTLYFNFYDSINYKSELWKVDSKTGTPSPVELPSGVSDAGIIGNEDGVLYLSAADPVYGRELWKIESASSTPVRLGDINPGVADSSPSDLIKFNGGLYFSATGSENLQEIWRLDPATGLTVQVTQVGFAGSSIGVLTNVNGALYFQVSGNEPFTSQLWKLDSNGNVIRINIAFSSSVFLENFTNVNGTLYATSLDSTGGINLLKVDPATNSAVVVTALQVNPDRDGSTPRSLVNAGGILYYNDYDSTSGTELWKIDPASGAPVRVSDINPGVGDSKPSDLTNVNGVLYFSAEDPASGREIWKIDPASGSPVHATDINPGSGSSIRQTGYPIPAIAGVEGKKLYLNANNGINGPELWVLDTNNAPTGTPTATLPNTLEDTPISISTASLLAGFSDVDLDPLSVSNLTASNGSLVKTLSAYTFTPSPNYSGPVTLSYSVIDGSGGTVTATQSFIVTPVNDAPVAASTVVSTRKNIGLFSSKITVDLSSLISDPDPNGLDGSKIRVFSATHGTVNEIYQDSRTVTFTPTVGFSGTASFDYSVTDAGGLTSEIGTVKVDVGDILFSGNRQGLIQGTSGNDYILGLSKNTTIQGGDGNDYIVGGAGTVSISGENGNDTLLGTIGNNTIAGGAGNDFIFGGGGADLLTGGPGRDKFVLDRKSADLRITDFTLGEDVLALSGGLSFGQLTIAGNGSDTVIQLNNKILATLDGIAPQSITADHFVTVTASDFAPV